ncbi:hypothetical protein [Noviherbaspirillum soli]|uniref:hypothetical protein n=1 Tax=Noviherbaspirillum soli TaxID=1064518 RepID=UPI00188B5AD5|nr:hypothetical protein [Noviherbaspirillum soli]
MLNHPAPAFAHAMPGLFHSSMKVISVHNPYKACQFLAGLYRFNYKVIPIFIIFMSIDTDFFEASIFPFETFLLEHELGELFTKGTLYDRGGNPVGGLELPQFGANGLSLTPVDVGRLFMAPDLSKVSINVLAEHDDGAPMGVNVSSDNPFVQPGRPVTVIAYQTDVGAGVRLDNLYLKEMILKPKPDSPDRFGTVAFGLMAATAFRHGFHEISLFAAGRGPIAPDDPDEMVGYFVWPKFGFDAELLPIDLQNNPLLQYCRSVQDVLLIDPAWWERFGSGREMVFDLRANSTSWNILLNYVFDRLSEE